MTRPPPTIAERITALSSRRPSDISPLPSPVYWPRQHAATDKHPFSHVFFGIESFQRHMTDEGWQLQAGLREADYELVGRHLDYDCTDVAAFIRDHRPDIAIMQDKREWDASCEGCLDKTNAFQNSAALANNPSIFKLTVLKDAHNNPPYHRDAAAEIGCHAWICYYHPDVVAHLAPYVRREHLIRTWHSLEPADVPPYSPDNRQPCLLSGAINRDLYPFRERLRRNVVPLGASLLQHPGYHARGHQTPAYLKILSGYKVAICTCSVFAYALRKICEATACGCVVITDLPPDETLPAIDGNLVRVHPDIGIGELAEIVKTLVREYDAQRQKMCAASAVAWYGWKRRGWELAEKIEEMRARYCD